MAKFKVRCYYQYVGRVLVEADSPEDAFEKGYKVCSAMATSDLEYVGEINAEVEHEDGEIEEFLM